MYFKFLLVICCYISFITASIPRKPFYCVRHCITEWNLLKKSQGHTDIPLHPLGCRQAKIMRELCHTLPITHFWSSPLLRAWQTMKILNKSLKVPEYIHGDLIERYMGALEGLTEEEWHKLDQQTLDQHLEPKHDVEKRTLRVLQEILSCEGIPCIVTHSNIVRMIAQLTGCKIKAVRQQVFLYFEPVGESDWEMTCIE